MTKPLRIVVGSDDAGYEYKETLKQDLTGNERVLEVIDVGVGEDGHTAYPLIAIAAAEAIAAGRADRGLLVCGTGIGVAHRSQQGTWDQGDHGTRQFLGRAVGA